MELEELQLGLYAARGVEETDVDVVGGDETACGLAVFTGLFDAGGEVFDGMLAEECLEWLVLVRRSGLSASKTSAAVALGSWHGETKLMVALQRYGPNFARVYYVLNQFVFYMGLLGGIIGGAAGAVGSIFGGMSRNRMLKEQMKLLREQQKANRDWYDRRYNEDATQRADAQAMLAHTAEAIRDRNRQAAGSAAVMGGTDESVAAAKAANAKAMADAASGIVQAGERRKDGIEQRFRERDDAYNGQMRQLQGQKLGLFDIASGALGSAASGFDAGYGL